MSTRHDEPIGDGERDAWLREALRHAPDADAAPPRGLSETILAQARAAARVGGAPARSARRRNPLLALWDWLARPPVAAGFASLMAATLVGLMWWDRPIDSTLPPRQEIVGQRTPSSPSADAGTATQSTERIDRNVADNRAVVSESRAPAAAAPAAPPAPSVGAMAPAAPPTRQQRKEEQTLHGDKAQANAAKVLTAQAPPPPQATIEAKEQRRNLDALLDPAPADRAAAKPSPFARSDDATVAAAAPAKKTDSDAKDAKASDGALGRAPADALAARGTPLAKSKPAATAAPATPAEVSRSEPPAAFGRERANELARGSPPSAVAESEAAKRPPAGAMPQATPAPAPPATMQAAAPAAAPPTVRDGANAAGAGEKQASAFEAPQAAQTQSELSTQRAGAVATPLTPIVDAIASEPARWSRSTSAGSVVALEAGWRDWLAQLDAAARGRWQSLGAADERERDAAATLRLVDRGRTTVVVRLEGTTVRVDAIERGERWQATLPPAAAERLRAAAQRLGR